LDLLDPGDYLRPEPGALDLEGKATFGFVAKYKKGATGRTGIQNSNSRPVI